MPAPQTALVTAADYSAMPDDGHRYQVCEGELTMAPAPNTYHQIVQGNLHHLLKSYLLRHPLGTVLGAPCDVFLDDHNVFQPDLLYVARDSKSARIEAHGIVGAPDLVVEILSAATAGLDRRKRVHFATHGTVEFWQIDPSLRQIQRFVFAENPAKPVALIDEPETFASPLFPGLVLATADIFRV